jgi:hypothetical protein
MTYKTDNSVDEAVLALLRKVEQKKKEIQQAKVRPSWKTNCSFGKDPSSSQDRTNIQTIRDPRKLIEIYAFLTSQQTELAKAATELGLEFDETWQNYSINDWKEDLKFRSLQLSIEKKQKELDELDARVNSLVSTEQRRVMELKALQQILQD